ncbi:class I SAM-dependent methyltransferase [Vulcaniibacterium gelatinicum]|uniref:class I SAM-dependent methyltransferase n=1 Tax=Vulcaniibacterium gelatinicum TaxID=2598725 RepID=UPI0015F2B2A4|nr:methyltransferase domain-containing protein [Vulcaniibacterium gelatinicum]
MSNPAETYERELVPVLFAPWAPSLLDLAALRPGERVLDLACGTGIVARGALARIGAGGRVSGVDMNPAMLAVARTLDGADAIEWHEGRMEALPFDDGTFDAVLCQHGLQFSPERPRAVAEMHRVLDEGGRVAIAVWQGLDRHPFFARFNELLERHLGIPAFTAPFSLGDADELRGLLETAGFRDVAIAAAERPVRFPNPDGYVAMQVDAIAAAIPATQHLDAAARAALAAAIGGEFRPVIDAAVQSGHIVVPMHAWLARAVR